MTSAAGRPHQGPDGHAAPAGADGLVRASVPDTLATAGLVVAPMLARGIIRRRPRMVALAARIDADRRAGRHLARLRARYGPGPVRLAVPARRAALILDPDDVHRVLAQSPDPFTPATREKRAALAHFQPHGVLISTDGARQERRRFTEEVLEPQRPVHRCATGMIEAIAAMTGALAPVRAPRELTWPEFSSAWRRTVRRMVLGEGASADVEVDQLLDVLRGDANWAFLRRRRDEPRERLLAKLRAHLDRAEPGSLARAVAEAAPSDLVRPESQVAHWLFAFDAAGIAGYRALALLATHPDARQAVCAELAGRDPLAEPLDLPFTRACLLESVRLWPTTLAILRETTGPTTWRGRHAPAGTLLVVVSSFFHRNAHVLPFAHRFEPSAWLDGRARHGRSLVPFSDGPAGCPGRSLVLLTTSTLLAALADRCDITLDDPGISPSGPLPGALDHTALRFRLAPRPDTEP